MSFRFFRPWEDGGRGNTRQTPNGCPRAPSEASKTTTPPQVLPVQAEQLDVPSKATRSEQVLPDIPGASYQEEEAHTTEKEDVRHELQLDTLSMRNSLAFQDVVSRQTSASGHSENAGSTSIYSDCTNNKAENHVRHTVNHVWKSSTQTEKHSSDVHKIQPSITLSHHTSLVPSQSNSSLQVTSANASEILGNNPCNLNSLSPSGSFATENNLHSKVTQDMTVDFSKDTSEMDHSKVVRHSSITKQEWQSRSTSMKDECCVEALSDGNSEGSQKRRRSKSFQCKTCGKCFSRSSNMHRYGQTHLEIRLFLCTFCKKTFSRLHNLHVHQCIHTGIMPFKCSVCEKTFRDSHYLHRHERIHTRSTPFKCTVCAKVFKQSSALHVHERIHTGSMPYKCSVCEKTFKQSGSLHRHERIHTGSTPFKCKVCAKAFKQSSALHAHERIHTGCKPFKCSDCEKAFKQSGSLHSHERIHTGSTPFKCKVCAKAFKQSSALHVHERIHTGSKPFKCSDCEKAFKQSGDLHKHERIHNGSKPFKCTVCEKAFAEKSNMHVHERIHTGSKPFKCSVCEKAFKHSGNLHRHERIHTGSRVLI